MADETAWIIERADGATDGPRYLMGIRQGYGAMWSTDCHIAIRFARQVDAKTIADNLESPAKCVEHMWCDPLKRRDITDGKGRHDVFTNPNSRK
jgi:hypothetical protein